MDQNEKEEKYERKIKKRFKIKSNLERVIFQNVKKFLKKRAIIELELEAMLGIAKE